MARIPLRTYLLEIEDLVEHGQIDAAVAHCKHILKFYPKNVDTYRLLGKAYLENQRYGDAADVLQRVLSSIPEDFVGHLGMSMIREDEGNLDEAIWHMERAFEVQPANAAVQGELRRLFGRRDGFEPPKVRLTRGALARMYVKGGLYTQAIAELRAALGEDPERPDLLAVLARAYFLGGQKVEAAEACSNLLSKLPYCLEANHLLAEILAGSERAGEAEGYRQRVNAQDPYAAHLSPTTPGVEQVPDEAVTLEKLEWRPGQFPGGAPLQPEWAASLSVVIAGIDDEKETLPEWLSETQPEAQIFPAAAAASSQPPESLQETAESSTELPAGQAVLGDEAAGPSDVSATSEEAIPDWMKSAGWEPSTGQAEESLPAFDLEDETPEKEVLAPAEIPDWLQSMAPESQQERAGQPPEGVEEPGQTLEIPPADDFLPWLSETPPGATDSSVSWLETKSPEAAGENLESGEDRVGKAGLPEWLQATDEPAELEPDREEGSEARPELPEWLASQEAEPEADEIPDWLQGLAVQPEPEAGGESLESPAGVLAGEAAEEQAGTMEQPAEPLGEETPESGVEEVPDWLRSMGEPPAEAMEPGSAGLPPAVAEPAAPGSTADEDEAFAWLEGLAAGQGANEALFTSPEERRDTPPDWVLDEAEAAAETTAAVPWEAEEPLEPGLTADEQALTEGKGSGSEAAALQAVDSDWVFAGEERPDAVEAAAPEQAGEEPLAPAELPDWLRDLEPSAGQPASPSGALPWDEPGEVELPPAERGEIPAWLAGAAAGLTGLTGLEEPPVSEEDTKPTRVALSSEVPIPPELAGYIAGEAADSAWQTEPAEELPTSPTMVAPEVGAAEIPDAEAGQTEAGAPQVEEAITGFAAVYSVVRQPPLEGTPADEATAGESQVPSEPVSETEPGEVPEWLQEFVETPEAQTADAPAGSEAPAAESGMSALEDEEAAFAWLESLAARQGAEEGLVMSPEERPEVAPDWIAAEAQAEPETQVFRTGPEAGAGEASEPETLYPAQTEALGELHTGEQPIPEQEDLAPVEDIQRPEAFPTETGWTAVEPGVVTGAQAGIDIEAAESTPEEPGEFPIEIEVAGEEQAVPELPDWLAGMEETADKAPEWAPEVEVEAPVSDTELAAEAAEPALLDLNQAALIDLERVPGIGFIRAQAILAYREAHGPLTGLDDLLEVPGFDPETLAQIQDQVVVEAPAEPELMGADQNQVALIQGRNALAQGEREAALECYSGLIEANALLPEVIHDLRDEGLYRFPIDVAIWQALGDAYFRDGQLQKAIDAYTKAEELLR